MTRFDNETLVRSCTDKDDPPGVVDPFLKEPVKTGEQFWMCVYRDKAVALRHEWKFIDAVVPDAQPEPEDSVPPTTPPYAEPEQEDDYYDGCRSMGGPDC